ncbi:aminoacyltransferase [Weissella coleopterorum]|uniref:Aminoacyltransferase n=1 Tax=Weissella coleopterorum TaxID=2714949 RepID=A0A6G8AZ95_9LACO|nr:peptidoglycan bridge formation glycyltransferase FemA/FemB family protein [Weissella coleopterorum]QIL50388.1 aminoacyltransferase [Weissella coleopterorum]
MAQIYEVDPLAWNDFEEKHQNGFVMQSLEQYQLLKARGRNVKIIGMKQNDELVAGAVVTVDKIHGGYKALMELGPVLDYEDATLVKTFLAEVKNYYQNQPIVQVEFSPYLGFQDFNDHGEPITEKRNDLLDNLTKAGAIHQPMRIGMTDSGAMGWKYEKSLAGITKENLLDHVRKDVKYYLKKNQQFGVTHRFLKRDELSEFKLMLEDTAARRGFHDKDLEYYQTVLDVYQDKAHFIITEINFMDYLNAEQATIAQLDERLKVLEERLAAKETKRNRGQFNEFTDQKNQHLKRIDKIIQMYGSLAAVPTEPILIAGAMFLGQGNEMDYYFSGMYDKYKDFYGPYLIQYEMMKMAVEQGFSTYNFLGIDGKFDGSDGVLEFKTEFEGHATQMIGEFVLPIHPLKYRALKLMKMILRRG